MGDPISNPIENATPIIVNQVVKMRPPPCGTSLLASYKKVPTSWGAGYSKTQRLRISIFPS